MRMSNKTYDTLKIVAWIIAPLITFIGALCEIWGIPYAIQITATLGALDTLLGSLLTLSNRAYNNEVSGDADDNN